MKNRRMVLAAGFMIFAALSARATDIRIIANSNVEADTISADELKRVFLKENNSLSDGTHVEPVLEKGGPVHEAFLRRYLGKTDDDLQNHYRTLVFTGKGSMPQEFGSDAEVVAYVARTRGTLGYVGADTNTHGVKTLTIVETGDETPRRLIRRVEPEYPETLRRLGIGGTVRLQVTISAKGSVERVELLGGNPILGESAISAVRQWVYTARRSRTVAEVSIPFDSRH